MKIRLLGSFVFVLMFVMSSTALASPRTGSISIPGGAPLMNGGTSGQDMTKVSGFYSPETGVFQVVIRFAAPVDSSARASIRVYPRTDSSGSCNPSPDDGFLLSNTSPEGEYLLGVSKAVSPDKYEIILEESQHENVDYKCIFVKIGTYEKVYDDLFFYFEGFGPQPVIQPTPVPQPTIIPTPSAPSAPTPEPAPVVKVKSPTVKQLLTKSIAKCKKINNKKKRAKCVTSAKRRYKKK